MLLSVFFSYVITGIYFLCHCRAFFLMSLPGFLSYVIAGLDPAIQFNNIAIFLCGFSGQA